MATAEVASQANSNVQAAQDVQNMLAELKEGSKPETATDPAVGESGDFEQEGNGVERTQSNIDEPDEKNEAENSESKTQGESEEGKKEGGTKGESGGRSGGHQPVRGGGKGRGSGRGRGGFKSYKENIKSDVTAQEETDDPVQIRKQVRLSCRS